MSQKEQQTFYNLKVTSADGKVDTLEYKSEKQYNDITAAAAKVGSQVEVLKQQTFVLTTADSIEDIKAVTPNDEVALGFYNYGCTLAQHNVKRDLMTDPDWQGVEGAYSLIDDVQEPKERRVADPLSASRKSLRAMWAKFHPGEAAPTDEQINAVLAQFAGVGQEQPTAA